MSEVAPRSGIQSHYISPKGAWEIYMERISSLEARNSSRVTQIISIIFARKVLDSFSCQADGLHGQRAASAYDAFILHILIESSSDSERIDSPMVVEMFVFESDEAFLDLFRSRVSGGNLHWPSEAMRAPSSSSFRSVTTVE